MIDLFLLSNKEIIKQDKESNQLSFPLLHHRYRLVNRKHMLINFYFGIYLFIIKYPEQCHENTLIKVGQTLACG